MRIDKSKVCLVKSSFGEHFQFPLHGRLRPPFDGANFICKDSLTKICNVSPGS